MIYDDLLASHLKYGTTKKDILKRNSFFEVLENVVIAPWWNVKMFEGHDVEITKINEIVYNIRYQDIVFTFLQLKAIGAPVMIDCVLELGVSKCNNLLFLGSVGSLDEIISIGDIVIPEYSICGDGASRYLNDNLEDDFGQKFYPDKQSNKRLIEICEGICATNEVKMHLVANFSVDTIFTQFAHLDRILDMGSKVIEMETASLFKAASIAKINACALLCVSDNTVVSKSLYSGITTIEHEYRHNVRYEAIPKIVFEYFKRCFIKES